MASNQLLLQTASGRRPASRTSFHPTLALLLLGLGLIIAIALAASESPLRGALISGTAIAIALPLLVHLTRRPLDIFEPIIPAAAALLAMFVLRPIVDQILTNYSHLGYNIYPTFDHTLFIVLVGCVAFSVGYISRFAPILSRMLPEINGAFPRRRALWAALLIALLGVTIWGTFISTKGGLPTLLYFLRGRSKELEQTFRTSTGYAYGTIYSLMPATFIFFLSWIRFRRLSLLIAAFLTGLPLVIWDLALGNRSDLLPILFGLSAIYYLSKGRRPKVLNVALLLLAGLLASPLIREMRTNDSGLSKKASDFITDPEASLASTFTADDDEMFDSLCTVVGVFPSRIAYNPLGVVTDVGIRALPRTLFPNKPVETNDQFIIAMWPWHYKAARGSTSCSIWGAFYMYGGLVGVILGCFALGVVLKGIWNWYLANANKPSAILLYAFVPALTIILLRGGIPDTLTRMFFTVLPALIAQRYWSRTRRISRAYKQA